MKPLVAAALASLCLFAAPPSRAQKLDLDPGADNMVRFTRARWSMISPDKDYEGGCVVGFLAFEFSPTGYFTFNNRIRGSWRIDELGNLKLRTRDGIRFTMLVDGGTIRPSQDVGNLLKRNQTFQRCSE